jgi:hypothetical protein
MLDIIDKVVRYRRLISGLVEVECRRRPEKVDGGA